MKRSILIVILSLCSLSIGYAQTKSVSGKVIDAATKQPLIGATVMITNTTTGTTTNNVGGFKINVPKDAKTLSVNYIGYVEKVIKIENEMTIALDVDTKQIDEVVIVGYNYVKKSDLTGAVGILKSEDLLKNSPISAEKGMQGRLSGVNVISSDGAPGSGINIQIRGISTFSASTDPLFVIDGVPMTTSNSQESLNLDGNAVASRNALSFLDPKDIESMEVLKDASSIALYGSRGANGVVLITTKSGRMNTADKIEFSYNTSINQVTRKIQMLTGQEYALYRNISSMNTQLITGGTFNPASLPHPGVYNDEGNYQKAPMDYGTDPYYWQDQIFRTAITHTMNLNISGGRKDLDYMIGGGYTDQNGVVTNSAFKRYSFRFSINNQVKNWLKIGSSTNFSSATSGMIKAATNNQNNGDEGVIRSALYFPATYLKTDKEALENEFKIVSNPVLYAQALNQNRNTSFHTSNYANATLAKGLIFRTSFGFNTSINAANQYWPSTLYEGREPINGKSSAGDNTWSSITFDNLLMYNHDFGNHNVSATLGTSWEESWWYNKAIGTTGFGSDLNNGWILGDGSNVQIPSSSKGESQLMSFIFRAAYNYSNKYFLTLTARRDASSKFTKGRRGAFFPSIGGSYRISEEKFMQPVNKVLSNMKIRYSYGLSGNQAINPYNTFDLMMATNYPFGSTVENGYARDPWVAGNKMLMWETTYQHDLGVDFTLFNNIHVVFDYYDKKTTDLLQHEELPASTGITRRLTNLGIVRNSGLELEVSATIMNRKDFSWTVGGNVSFNKNEVVQSNGAKMFPNALWSGVFPFVIEAGRPIGQIFGYVEDGIWNSREEVINSAQFQNQYSGYKVSDRTPATELIIKRDWVGEIRYKNVDGSEDGAITESDRTYIGNSNPKLFFGFNMGFNYKNFDMSVMFQGVYGNDIVNVPAMRYVNLGGTQNVPYDYLKNAWTQESSGTNPKIFYNSGRKFQFSDRYIEDGSYLKLRNIMIGYTLKNPIKGISNLRIFAGGNNLFTITKYTGYDPEISSFGSDPTRRGVDAGGYPQSKSYVFGVNATF